MKLGTSQAETSGNLTFKRQIAMRLDDSARALIIKSIIDMYSNPYVAAMREYTSNAVDSHVWAGENRPVSLTLPTRLQPNLIVQDWGIGLSAAELEDYSQFGTSTKRDTNDQIGGFGFGSKSGLAVCSRFTVESVKDGKRSVIVIGRDADGPQMGMLIEDEDTDLPNGLKVTIPTSEQMKFEYALAHNFFLGWKPGTIEVNGEQPKLSVYDTSKFEELPRLGWLNIDTEPSHWSTHDYTTGQALVGPVAYKIQWREIAGIPSKATGGILQEVVVKLDNGSVDLTPSRENLIYSKRTREHIKERVDAILAEGKKKYQERVESAGSLREAMMLMLRAIEFGFEGKYTYQGKSIEFGTVSDDAMNAQYTVCDVTRGGASGISSSRTAWAGRTMLQNWHYLSSKALGDKHSVLVLNAGDLESTSRYRTEHKIATQNTMFARALADRDGIKPFDYTITYTEFDRDKFPDIFLSAFVEIITADEAKALTSDFRKSLRASASASRVAAPKHDQDVVRMVSHFYPGRSTTSDRKIADLDVNKTYIVLKNGEEGIVDIVRRVIMFQVGNEMYGNYINTILGKVANDGEYVFLLANKSWKTENYSTYLPKMVTFEEAAQKVYAGVVTSLTPIQRLAGATRGNHAWTTYITGRDLAGIQNAELVEYIKAANDPTIATRLEFIRDAAKATHYGITLEAKFSGEVPTNPCVHYPLLEHLSFYGRGASPEVVKYINLIDTVEGRITPNA